MATGLTMQETAKAFAVSHTLSAHRGRDVGPVEAGDDPGRLGAVHSGQVSGHEGVLVGARLEIDLRAELDEVDGAVVEGVIVTLCSVNTSLKYDMSMIAWTTANCRTLLAVSILPCMKRSCSSTRPAAS